MKHILAAIVTVSLAAAAFGHGYMHNKPFRMAEHRAKPACPAAKQAPQNAPCEFQGKWQAPCAYQNKRNTDGDGYACPRLAERPRCENWKQDRRPACFDGRECVQADNRCGFQGKRRMDGKCAFAQDRPCDGPRAYKHANRRGGHFRGGPACFSDSRRGGCPAFEGRHWRAPEGRPCAFDGNTGRPTFRGHYRDEAPCFAKRHFRECPEGRPPCARFEGTAPCGFNGKARMEKRRGFCGNVPALCGVCGERHMNGPRSFKDKPRMDAPRGEGKFRGRHARFDDRRECPAMERRAPDNACMCAAPSEPRRNWCAFRDAPRKDKDGARQMRGKCAEWGDGRRGGDAPECVRQKAPAPKVCPVCGERHGPMPE